LVDDRTFRKTSVYSRGLHLLRVSGQPCCHPHFSVLATPLASDPASRACRLERWRNLHCMSDEPANPSSKLQVQIDDDVAQGVYANLVLINHTENEFVLDFAFIQPSNGRTKVRSRIVSSPKHTKRLLMALQKNVERYEERFGRIELGPDDESTFH
jgi:hypothetical protein